MYIWLLNEWMNKQTDKHTKHQNEYKHNTNSVQLHRNTLLKLVQNARRISFKMRKLNSLEPRAVPELSPSYPRVHPRAILELNSPAISEFIPELSPSYPRAISRGIPELILSYIPEHILSYIPQLSPSSSQSYPRAISPAIPSYPWAHPELCPRAVPHLSPSYPRAIPELILSGTQRYTTIYCSPNSRLITFIDCIIVHDDNRDNTIT